VGGKEGNERAQLFSLFRPFFVSAPPTSTPSRRHFLGKPLPPLIFMDAILSRLSHLEEQARLQAATIASLRSENKALSSAVARLSAQSESKDTFTRQVEARLFPEGFWVREKANDGAAEGCWAWSWSKVSFTSPSLPSPPSLPRLYVFLLSFVSYTATHTRRSLLRLFSFFPSPGQAS